MYKRHRKTRRSSLLRQKNSSGGANVPETQEERITNAVRRNYTPLINAILERNTGEVRRILDRGGNANQSDDTYHWCPYKWLDFVLMYGGRNGETISDTDYRTLVEMIHRAGGQECYDENHIRAYSYNFSPVVTDIDEQLEQLRREAEEDSYDDDYDTNRTNTSGGRNRRKTQKYLKSQKRNNKKRRTRKRKHMKK
jgi:hypothetical protein